MHEALRELPQFTFDMRTRTFLLAVMILSACFIPSEEHNLGSGPAVGPLGGGSSGGTGGGGGTSGTFQRCVLLVFSNESLCTTVWPVVCGGQTCGEGEVCCQTTGACVAPGSAQCPSPPSSAPNNPKSCGSSADCSSDEFCAPDEVSRCIAASGHCVAMNNCGYCSAPGSDRCQVCGCDGVTYASMQVACVAGVNAVHSGKCGVPAGYTGPPAGVACGKAEQCPVGAQCCFRTGRCFDPSEPWRCEPQPDGTLLNCLTDAECNQGSGGGSGSQEPTAFCGGASCSATPGRCLGRGSASSCGGEVKTVCGCDGTTYVNDCWARVGGTRVAHLGACP